MFIVKFLEHVQSVPQKEGNPCSNGHLSYFKSIRNCIGLRVLENLAYQIKSW